MLDSDIGKEDDSEGLYQSGGEDVDAAHSPAELVIGCSHYLRRCKLKVERLHPSYILNGKNSRLNTF